MTRNAILFLLGFFAGMTRNAILFWLGFFAVCATASIHNHSAIRDRLDALEKIAEPWASPHLVNWATDDPRLRALGGEMQCVKFAHPEIAWDECDHIR